MHGQTKQYAISIDALFNYTDAVDRIDLEVKIPVGIFSSKPAKRMSAKKLQINIDRNLDEEFKEWLAREWKKVLDKLTIKSVKRLTCYSDGTIQRWLANNMLKHIKLEDSSKLITKEWLFEFYYSEGQWIVKKCDKHVKLMGRYNDRLNKGKSARILFYALFKS